MYWDKSSGIDEGGYRQFKYLPLSDIPDLLDQFNYVGYHDVCIRRADNDVSFIKNPDDLTTKGVQFVMKGHISHNQSGKHNMISV